MGMNRALTASAAAAVLLLAASCGDDTTDEATGTGTAPSSSPSTEASATATPNMSDAPPGAWEVVDPTVVGMDAAKLEELRQFLDEGSDGCAVVVKDGRVAAEWYFGDGASEDTLVVASVTKSFTSTLVGIAEAQGHLDIDQPASDFITEWQGTRAEPVTIRNLLSMDSGRLQAGEDDLEAMFAEPDHTRYAIGLPQVDPPGERWVYSNAGVQALEAVLERATDSDVEQYAQDNLFDPIGMRATIDRDGAGNPLVFGGLLTSCLDAARFGWLFDQRGTWNGTEVVPAGWVEEATRSSQDLNRGYGLLWWLNSGGPDGTASEGSRAWPDAPSDAYAAWGLGDQEILVLPSDDIVVVRLHDSFRSRESEGAGTIHNQIARLVLASVTS